jgi:hypothetical protein
MTEEKKEVVKIIYYVSIGGNEYIATDDKSKALELWNLLSDSFFRIAAVGSSYLSSYAFKKNRSNEDTTFLYKADISDEGGITLKTMSVFMYPDELSAMKAKAALEQMKDAGKSKDDKTVPF